LATDNKKFFSLQLTREGRESDSGRYFVSHDDPNLIPAEGRAARLAKAQAASSVHWPGIAPEVTSDIYSHRKFYLRDMGDAFIVDAKRDLAVFHEIAR
jgi:hypothetical protein